MDEFRQGDIYIVRIGSKAHKVCTTAKGVPTGDSKKRTTGHILEGEVTGHIHRLSDLDAAEVFECGEGLYLNVTAEGGVSVVHEEHKPVILSPGNYEVVRQREYSPEAIRNVTD